MDISRMTLWVFRVPVAGRMLHAAVCAESEAEARDVLVKDDDVWLRPSVEAVHQGSKEPGYAYFWATSA
jgi:hypothetical protein